MALNMWEVLQLRTELGKIETNMIIYFNALVSTYFKYFKGLNTLV